MTKLNPTQLLDELQTLQVYNVHLFMHLNHHARESDSMAMYLELIDEFGHYLKWAKATLNLDGRPRRSRLAIRLSSWRCGWLNRSRLRRRSRGRRPRRTD